MIIVSVGLVGYYWVSTESSVVDCQVSDRKVADSWFDSRAGNALLRLWERHFYANFPLGPSSLHGVVTQPDKRLANRSQEGVLCIGVLRQTQSVWFIQTDKPLTAAFTRCLGFVEGSWWYRLFSWVKARRNSAEIQQSGHNPRFWPEVKLLLISPLHRF